MNIKLSLLKFFTFVVAASVFALVIFVKPSGNTGLSGQTFSASVSKVFPAAPTESRILLQSPSGGGVWVNNFYKSAIGADSDAQAVVIKRTQNYDILYYPATGGLEIALSLSASASDRAEGEQALFDILGVSKKDICRLNAYVSELTSSGDKADSPLTLCQSVFR